MMMVLRGGGKASGLWLFTLRRAGFFQSGLSLARPRSLIHVTNAEQRQARLHFNGSGRDS